MPSGFGGLTDGLYESINQTRKENAEHEERAFRRESEVLNVLSNSDDPEIRAMAVAGMLEQANPRRRSKGLRGFLGEMEQSQTLPKIRELLNTPVATQVNTPGLPSRGVPAGLSMYAGPSNVTGQAPGQAPAPQPVQAPPAGAGAAALPSGSPVTGTGMPPPRGTMPPPAPTTGASGISAMTERRGTPEVGRTDTVMKPRQVFLNPDERLRRDTTARESAEVEGKVSGLVAAGFTRPEALDLIRQEMSRRYGGSGRGAGFQKQAVEIPDGKGGTTVMFAAFDPTTAKFFDPDTGQVIADARPVSSAARMSFGIEAERAARAKYGKSFGQLTPEESNDIVHNELPKIAGQISGSRARATGDEQIVTEFNKPISIDNAAQLQVPVGTTLATATGQIPQTPAQQELRQSMTALTPQLDAIATAAAAVLPSTGDLAGYLPGAYIATKMATDPEYKVKMAALTSALDISVNNVARILGAQKGAQTEQDAMRAYNSLVNLKGAIQSDTIEAVQARLQETRAAMARVQAAMPQQMTVAPPVVPTTKTGPTAVDPTKPAPTTAAPPAPAPAPAPAAQARPVGTVYEHPVHGRVKVMGINPATGKERVQRTTEPVTAK